MLGNNVLWSHHLQYVAKSGQEIHHHYSGHHISLQYLLTSKEANYLMILSLIIRENIMPRFARFMRNIKQGYQVVCS